MYAVQTENGKRYAVACGNTNCTHGLRLLRKSDAVKAEATNSFCYHCSQQVKGRKGWAAASTNPKFQYAKWMGLRAYRLAHRSNLEQQAEKILRNTLLMRERLQVEYLWIENDHSFYLYDFYVPALNFMIEVQGFWHNQEVQMVTDMRKRLFCEAQGIRLLEITTAEFENGQYVTKIVETIREQRKAKRRGEFSTKRSA